MNKIGKPLAIIGGIILLFAFNMDVSVQSGYGRVNNIGLMADRNNYLLLGALALIAGLILTSRKRIGQNGESNAASDEMKCPFCAELIKSEAKLCKHCKSQIDRRVDQEAVIAEQSGVETLPSLPAQSAAPQKAWNRSKLNASCRIAFESTADRATVEKVVAEEISKVEKKFDSRNLILTSEDDLTAEVLIRETATNAWQIELNFFHEKHLVAFGCVVVGGIVSIVTDHTLFFALILAAFISRLLFTGKLTKRKADQVLVAIQNRLQISS